MTMAVRVDEMRLTCQNAGVGQMSNKSTKSRNLAIGENIEATDNRHFSIWASGSVVLKYFLRALGVPGSLDRRPHKGVELVRASRSKEKESSMIDRRTHQ